MVPGLILMVIIFYKAPRDVWTVIGENPQFSLVETVQIFNRYGKLITVLNPSNLAWDGTLNGTDLPSDDYWFLTRLLDGNQYTGHFALKR